MRRQMAQPRLSIQRLTRTQVIDALEYIKEEIGLPFAEYV